jgi:hypothetical protein
VKLTVAIPFKVAFPNFIFSSGSFGLLPTTRLATIFVYVPVKAFSSSRLLFGQSFRTW